MHSDMTVGAKEEDYTVCLNGFVENHSHGPWFCITGKNKPEATEAKFGQAAQEAKKRFSVLGFLKLLPECRKQDRKVIEDAKLKCVFDLYSEKRRIRIIRKGSGREEVHAGKSGFP